MRARLGVAIAVVAAATVIAPAAQARDAIVESFDGTPIVAHFFTGSGASEAKPAPTIMIGPGWGSPGATDPNKQPIVDFASAGYNVLTWDPRGFGGSGGSVMIDHPQFEGRDAQALIDFIAEQGEAKLDSAGDPRLGMSGGSYGGGIQLILAGLDERVDVIAPTIAWNSLVTSLFKADKVKVGWGLGLTGLGIPQSIVPGVFSPAGVQTGNQSEQFFSTVVEGVLTGGVSAANKQWFAEHGPDYLLEGIKVPTLIVQGTVDTLFTLDEAAANYAALRKQGVPLRMVFMCGGHGVCLTKSDKGAADSERAQTSRLAWFDRYLRARANTDTGPAFEWIDEDGAFHTSERFPLKPAGSLTGAGSGTLPLTPGISPPPGSGLLLLATPQPLVAVRAPIAAAAGREVVGTPQLSLTYSGTAVPAQTHVFAQIVDRRRDIVVGNQATPIPVTLDGVEHTIEIPLESIASLSTDAGYELEIISGTTLYDIQRSAGAIDVITADVSLPVGIGYDTPAPGCLRYPFGTKAADRLVGSAGRDCLRGKGGRDRIKALAGDDVIRVAGGGADRVDCGPGRDKVVASEKKDRVKNCETVKRR